EPGRGGRFADPRVPPGAERAAAGLVPSRKPGEPVQPQTGPGGGGGNPSGPASALTNYYAMEARNFADGRRSVLDIRNALAAEFGPVSLDGGWRFFVGLGKAGTFTLTTVTVPAPQERRKK